MKALPILLTALTAAVVLIPGPRAAAAAGITTETTRRPNILLIVADDLGFSDPGCYGGGIDTPNLDRLAAGGLRFSQFHNTARCWPTRASVLTGYYAQQVRRDKVPDLPSGGAGTRPEWAPLLSEVFRKHGYRTYHSGKWHLDGMPLQSGFDRSYHLRDQGRFFSPKTHWEDDRRLPEVDPADGYYATTAIADHALACLREHGEHYDQRPFFHYLAFTAPHFPLHAMPQDIAVYKGRYDAGWDQLRQRRWQRIQDMNIPGLWKLSPPEREIGPPYHFPEALSILGEGEVNRPWPWDSLSAIQKSFQAAKMEIHAAMVHRMDIETGRILDQLESSGMLDNTLILFLSDNGASAEIMVRADGHDPDAPPGSGPSYLCLGPGWSTVCNTPFRMHKTWVHAGGCATPLILSWYAGIAPDRRGQWVTQPGHVIDLVPTLAALAGVELPESPVPRPGINLSPWITGETGHENIARQLWWLHEGNRALVDGDWKIVARAGHEWELFNLRNDRTETMDLADAFPGKVSSLGQRWEGMWEQIKADARAMK